MSRNFRAMHDRYLDPEDYDDVEIFEVAEQENEARIDFSDADCNYDYRTDYVYDPSGISDKHQSKKEAWRM